MRLRCFIMCCVYFYQESYHTGILISKLTIFNIWYMCGMEKTQIQYSVYVWHEKRPNSIYCTRVAWKKAKFNILYTCGMKQYHIQYIVYVWHEKGQIQYIVYVLHEKRPNSICCIRVAWKKTKFNILYTCGIKKGQIQYIVYVWHEKGQILYIVYVWHEKRPAFGE